MLMFGFAHEVADTIKTDVLKERIDGLIQQRLKGELSRCTTCAINCQTDHKHH